MLQTHYLAQRDELISVIQSTGATGNEPVPACPGWSVADVIRHLLGLADNWLTGDLEIYASADWTRKQVVRWSNLELSEAIEAWIEYSDRFVEILDDLGAAPHLRDVIATTIGPTPTETFGGGIVVDLTQHCHDIAEALDATLGDPAGTVDLLTPQLLGAVSRRWRKADHEPVQVVSLDTGVLGRIGDRNAECTRTVSAPTVELFRSMGGRRSAEQLRNLTWEPAPPSLAAMEDFVVPFFDLPAPA